MIAPPSAREAVKEAAPVEASGDIMDDPALRLGLVAGTKEDEFALTVERNGDVTLLLNDILSNVRHPEGLGANIMARLFAFGVKRPRTSRTVRHIFVDEPAVVAAQFRQWAGIRGLKRIIVSHGDVIETSPEAALLRAAEDFG